ncbi:DsrE family protein [Sphingomicrobium flavum]|uniref:DsrE family protein n=1 Tax=Sphingomicrobium flavum TaxID=1229164 RepID=UPI0021AD744C|nr:DsrE family protein [Sphingomicrobium flavum]
MLSSLIAPLFSLALAAQPAGWETGPVIEGHGPHAPVEMTMEIAEGTVFNHAFDAVKLEEDGASRTLASAARFINMHAAAGVPADAIRPAVVIHGAATFAVVNDERFDAYRKGETNPNRDLVEKLLAAGTRIIVCGQSAAAQDVATADLLPGVEMALSAMTAHALLQQQGYTLNPF